MTAASANRLKASGNGPARRPGPDVLVSLADRLALEFDAPVGLLDPMTRAWRARSGGLVETFPDAESSLAAFSPSGPNGHGQAALWRPDPASAPIWLGLPIPRPEGPALIALIGFASGPRDVGSEAVGLTGPERALRAWGQSVADRLRAEAARRGNSAILGEGRERPLPDRLARKLRVSDPPEKFQRLASTALREALDVAAVAWVPCHPREPVIVAGEVEGLSADGYRGLLQDAPGDPVWIVNRPVGPLADAVRRIAVVADDAETSAGWIVAINTRDDRPFAAAEIELLHPIASLVGVQRANARLYADLKDLLFGVIRALTSAIDAKDPYTSGHSERVARIATRLGEALGMSANQRGDLYLMGLLHDVGKIGIEDGVLKKQGALTPDEYRLIQSHVRIGVHILTDLKKLHHLLPGVAHHHESWDGTGYPSGLAGEAIPFPARILAVADAFDAMSSTRPYRRRLTPLKIDEIFREGAGVQWDAKIVEALFACRADVEHIRQKGLGESLRQAVGETLGRS